MLLKKSAEIKINLDIVLLQKLARSIIVYNYYCCFKHRSVQELTTVRASSAYTQTYSLSIVNELLQKIVSLYNTKN